MALVLGVLSDRLIEQSLWALAVAVPFSLVAGQRLQRLRSDQTAGPGAFTAVATIGIALLLDHLDDQMAYDRDCWARDRTLVDVAEDTTMLRSVVNTHFEVLLGMSTTRPQREKGLEVLREIVRKEFAAIESAKSPAGKREKAIEIVVQALFKVRNDAYGWGGPYSRRLDDAMTQLTALPSSERVEDH